MTILETTLLDVRSRKEAAKSSIPGTLNIPHSEIINRINEIPEADKIVVFCSSGRRSIIIAEVLSALGYNAYNLRTIENVKKIYC